MSAGKCWKTIGFWYSCKERVDIEQTGGNKE